MSYKDKEKELETTRERVRRYRDNQKGVTLSGVMEQGVTKYPAILYALTDPAKRKKLEMIVSLLNRRKLAPFLYYGYPRLGGVPFDAVGDLLDATG